MKILVTDIGYGDTKWILVDNGSVKQGKLPTLIAPVLESVGFGVSKALSFGGRSYLVGSDARFAQYVIPTTTEDFLTTYSPLIIAKILLSESVETVDLVVVSLSLRDWDKRNRLKEAVSGFVVSRHSFTQEVQVYPQGLGIWKDHDSPANALIIDIGFNTVDVLVVVEERPSRDHSFAISGLGTKAFLSEITKLVNEKASEDFTTNEVADYVQSESPFLKKLGVLDEVKARSINWFRDLWSHLESRPAFNRSLKLLDVAILAGGGARFVEGPLDPKVKVVMEQPEFANVRGFLKQLQEDIQRETIDG